MHLVGCTIKIYYDVWTYERQRLFILVGNTLNFEIHLIIILKLISYLTQNTLHLPYKDQLR